MFKDPGDGNCVMEEEGKLSEVFWEWALVIIHLCFQPHASQGKSLFLLPSGRLVLIGTYTLIFGAQN